MSFDLEEYFYNNKDEFNVVNTILDHCTGLYCDCTEIIFLFHDLDIIEEISEWY